VRGLNTFSQMLRWGCYIFLPSHYSVATVSGVNRLRKSNCVVECSYPTRRLHPWTKRLNTSIRRQLSSPYRYLVPQKLSCEQCCHSRHVRCVNYLLSSFSFSAIHVNVWCSVAIGDLLGTIHAFPFLFLAFSFLFTFQPISPRCYYWLSGSAVRSLRIMNLW